MRLFERSSEYRFGVKVKMADGSDEIWQLPR